MTRPSPPIDESFVDLHGVTLAEVNTRLAEELRRAFVARTKRVVFVHGSGNHNDKGASPLAARVRDYLKALLDSPRSVVRRLEFGEESTELRHNVGCVRVTLALQLARDDVVYTPRAAPARIPPTTLDKKRVARRAPDTLSKCEQAALDEAEAALRRKFGEPGLGEPYRPPREKDGEWPGHR
jgi:hypothetical protein